ncbi:MAG: transposase [Deltaproteobacteria bacterium]|nr:transposase [Deltaproteobacteria bacterium]
MNKVFSTFQPKAALTSGLRAGLEWWFRFYNQERPHQTFDILTPDEVYMGLTAPVIQAA